MTVGWRECLDGLVLAGRMSQKQAAEVADLTERLQGEYAKALPMDAAERAAAERAAVLMKERKLLEKRQKVLQALRTHENVRDVQSHPEGLAAGVVAKLTKDSYGAAPWSNVEGRMHHWEGIFHGKLSAALDAYRAKHAGLTQDRAGIRQFVRELFGEDTKNPTAKAGAKAWAETTELARKAANAAGADIKKRADWHVPNHHDARRIHKAGRDAWVAFTRNLNIEARDPETGAILAGRDLDAALAGMWETLATDGVNTVIPGAQGKRRLAGRLGDPRTLQFKDAESWLRYNDLFGAGNIYSLLTGYVHAMARDIASMEILGPNPDAMVVYLTDLARKERVAKGKRQTGIGTWLIGATYDQVTGRVNDPVSERLAKTFGGTRNVLSVAHLRRAMLSAVSDLKFLQQTAAFNGMEATKVIKRHLSLLNPANAEDRRFAVKMGTIAEAWISKALAAKRFQDEIVGDGWTAHLADTFHRLTGLTPWTEAGRHAFGLEYLGFLADNAGKILDELPDGLRQAFRRYGIGAELWDAARTAKPASFKGAKFLHIEAIAESGAPRAKEAAERIHEMILEETDFAVPVPDARTRAFTNLGLRRGTLGGELARSVLMYRSFPIAVVHTHLMRGARLVGMGSKGWYLASLITGLTVMGGAVLALKDISYGKNPRPMDTQEFWGQAFAQGGGLGIFGDFIASGLSRHGQTLPETLAGPLLGGLSGDVARVVSPAVRQVYTGEDPNTAAELIRFAQRYAPMETWYSALALDRLLWNQIQILGDPEYARSFRRLERQALEKGTGYWWHPGELGLDGYPKPPRLSVFED